MALLGQPVCRAIMKMDMASRNAIREIRLRTKRPLCVDIAGKSFFLSPDGGLSGKDVITVSPEDMEKTVNAVFGNSFYSYRRELTAGYMTVSGGCRVGFCGSAVLDEKNGFAVESVKNISSLNIRIPREVKGCAQEIADSFGVSGLLLAGPPCSGKTTYLRDITRLLGNSHNVSLIDERNEIAAVHKGIPANDIGAMTDVFTSYNRYEAVISAVRSMSPEFLVCDEIGSEEDLKALGYAVNSGVRIIASCHCTDIDELYRKPVIRRLLEMGVFDRAVLLENGSVSACRELRKTLC